MDETKKSEPISHNDYTHSAEAASAAHHAEDIAAGAALEAREALQQVQAAATAAAETKASVELFELCSALLLGLGATLGSIAGYQGGLWGGKSIECFSQSAAVTTKAADLGTFADSKIASDSMIKLQTIELVRRAQQLPKGEERTALMNTVSELYLRELSDEAYESFELPLEPRKKYDSDKVVAHLPEEVLLEAYRHDFQDGDYYSWMYEGKVKKTKEAKVLFEEGQKAGSIGDEFALNGVHYTLSLFFAGLGLVFKSRVRWGFFSLGSAVLLGAIIYMSRLQWA